MHELPTLASPAPITGGTQLNAMAPASGGRHGRTRNDVLPAKADLIRLGCHDGQCVTIESEVGRTDATQ